MVGVNHKEAKKRLQEIIADSKSKSLRAFALSINIDPSLIAKVIGDQRILTPAMVKAVVEKYHVNEDWLLHGEGEKYGQNKTNGQTLPGSVTLQDHIELLKKQATIAEADKDRLFNNNETLARALEKLGSVYEKIIANSDATKEQLDAIVDQLRAEHAVMMDALDRLEKNKVGTNAMQAGNLEIERKKFRAGKGKQVGAGK